MASSSRRTDSASPGAARGGAQGGRRRVRRLVRLAAPAVLAAGFFAAGVLRTDGARGDAVVYEALCRQLLRNTTEGRQAFVSSVVWAPLPALLRLPLVAALGVESFPAASILLSAVFGAVALGLAGRVFRKWGLGAGRFVLVGALGLSPEFLAACLDGGSSTPALCLAIGCAYAFVEWLRGRRLRHLMVLGLAAAALAVHSPSLGPWLLCLFALMAVDVFLHISGPRQKEAVFIMVLLPLAYTVGLWILMNWLIMGDGLYFLRCLWACRPLAAESAAAGLSLGALHKGALAISLLAALLAALRRDRAGVYLGLLGPALVAAASLLAALGLLWGPAPLLFMLFPLAVMSAGHTACRPGGRNPVRRAGPVFAPAVLSLAMWLIPGTRAGFLGPGPDLAAIAVERNTWRPRIARHVLSRSPHAKVFVCGYDGFRLLGPEPDRVFEYAFDFSFGRVKHDYPGHDLYVLVHRPAGRSAMDSIHWRYDRIYNLGSRSTLYDGDWGDWRLFEIIQAPRH